MSRRVKLTICICANSALGTVIIVRSSAAQAGRAQADLLDRAHLVAEAAELANPDRLVGEQDEAADDVLERRPDGQGDREPADAEAGDDRGDARCRIRPRREGGPVSAPVMLKIRKQSRISAASRLPGARREQPHHDIADTRDHHGGEPREQKVANGVDRDGGRDARPLAEQDRALQELSRPASAAMTQSSATGSPIRQATSSLAQRLSHFRPARQTSHAKPAVIRVPRSAESHFHSG